MPAPRLIPTIDSPVLPSADAPRFGGRPTWSPRELQVIRERYPAGGAVACAPYLPARTTDAITERARKLGVQHYRGYTRPAPSTPELDEAIRKLYSTDQPKDGAMRAFTRKWGRTRQWVRSRAIQLGAVRLIHCSRHWTAAEDALLLELIERTPRTIQLRLARQLGITDRTEPAIVERVRYLRRTQDIRRDRDPDLFTAREAAELMGVDHRVVRRWIDRGLLAAKPRLDELGYIARYEIRRASLREFLIRYPAEWHPGRCDRYWLIEILSGRVGAAA